MRQAVGRRRPQRVVCEDESRPGASREDPARLAERRVGDDHRCVGVANDVFELRRGVRYGERHRHAAGAPDAALDCRVGKPGGNEERDARLIQIIVVAEQRAGHARGRLVQLIVRIGAAVRDNRDATRHRGIISNAWLVVHHEGHADREEFVNDLVSSLRLLRALRVLRG
jgi:hypothetical protein